MNDFRRAPWHDYCRKGFYHITLMKHPDAPAFGCLAGDWRRAGEKWGAPYVRASVVGNAIKAVLRQIGDIHRALKLFQYALMPDHLHIYLGVAEDLDEHLGRKIASFKGRVNRIAGLTVFAPDYHDHILMDERTRLAVNAYIRDNALRLAVRRANPDFFSKRHCIEIDGAVFLTFGNINLLSNPYIEQVVVHRVDSAEVRERNMARWMHASANGGVLVSPFISQAEKEVRDAGEGLGARLIKLINRPYGEREKPWGHDFDLCAQGRLLVVMPQREMPAGRATFLYLNGVAEAIAAGRFSILAPAMRGLR